MQTNPPPNNGTSEDNTSSVGLLKTLGKRLNEVIDLMRSQQELLKKRAINLPSGSLDELRTLKKRLEILTKSITDGQSELRSLRALAETTALINSAQKADDVLNQVMDTVIALTGAERGYIVMKNSETKALEFRVARGMDQATLDGSQGMIVSKSIVNSVADTGEAVLSDNASKDERYQSQESIVGFQLRSILAVPLKVQNEVVGVVYCDNRFLQGLFRQSELDVLKAFANQAAVAIENARLFEATAARLQEITELRDRMSNLFTSIASGVLTVDERDKILVCNATMQAICGKQDMVGMNLNDLLPAMPASFAEALKLVRDTHQPQELDLEIKLDGKTRHWFLIATPLGGTRGGVAMVIDDMTEQKRSESQLSEARRYLPSALVDSMISLDINNIEVEEREISALFADVRGFTSFSENLQPEELMAVINKYLSIASDSIGLFEGIVDKFMGDAVTGLWNTQLNSQHDHANRAVQAAMQLVLDLHAMHEVLPENERLFYGIGVHTGAAVLGNVGGSERREFSALGDAPDTCKYLQEQAGPGEVIISEATFHLVSGQWEAEPLTHVVRPKAGYEDVKMYRVIKRKKGAVTSLIDEELLALLADDEE